MPSFNFVLAHDVCAYGTVTVEAADLAAAVEKVRDDLDTGAMDLWSDVTEPEWDTGYNFRIVNVEDDGSGASVQGVAISEPDESTPLSAEAVLTALTAALRDHT